MKRISLLCLFIGFGYLPAEASTTRSVSYPPATRPITVENMTKELLRHGVAHWKVVLAQSITEAGWAYNSYLFKQTNNFIGMRVPGSRPSMRTDHYRGYSKYARWEDCVIDVKIWQKHFWQGGTQAAYITRMHNVWAESPTYRLVLLSIIKRIEQLLAQYVDDYRDHFNFMVINAYLQYYQLQQEDRPA